MLLKFCHSEAAHHAATTQHLSVYLGNILFTETSFQSCQFNFGIDKISLTTLVKMSYKYICLLYALRSDCTKQITSASISMDVDMSYEGWCHSIVRPFLNPAHNTKLLLTLALHILYSGNTLKSLKRSKF